jgi:hypothetical protein
MFPFDGGFPIGFPPMIHQRMIQPNSEDISSIRSASNSQGNNHQKPTQMPWKCYGKMMFVAKIAMMRSYDIILSWAYGLGYEIDIMEYI